ncbi:hypothetical protein F5X98DRAFT_14757 [Xylaria grammica]|nr:hypothetical protein F5X98DRAFT_14757 [Xylaria grammica]
MSPKFLSCSGLSVTRALVLVTEYRIRNIPFFFIPNLFSLNLSAQRVQKLTYLHTEGDTAGISCESTGGARARICEGSSLSLISPPPIDIAIRMLGAFLPVRISVVRGHLGVCGFACCLSTKKPNVHLIKRGDETLSSCRTLSSYLYRLVLSASHHSVSSWIHERISEVVPSSTPYIIIIIIIICKTRNALLRIVRLTIGFCTLSLAFDLWHMATQCAQVSR